VNSWKVILATIVIFGAGVITGGLLVDHVKHPRAFRPPVLSPTNSVDAVPPVINPEFLKKQFIQQLKDKLDLTPEQTEKIQKIITQGQENTHDLWRLVAPQFQVLWRDTRQQIRDVLTPEQRKQFETLMKQHARHQPPANAPNTNSPATNGVPAAPSESPNAPAI
jgi:hypothetical protein